jgi:DNA-directed RNA polymerase subunit RPC12/RpoP
MRPGDPPTRDPVDACIMSTEKLRREIAALKARGLANCPECAKNAGYRIVLKNLPPKPGDTTSKVWDPSDDEPKRCPRCGREEQKFVIRMKGLREKSRGDASVPHDSP